MIEPVAQAGRQVRFRDGAAPGDIARIAGLGAREELAAAAGLHAVRQDEHVAAPLLPVGEAQMDAARILVEPGESHALVVAAAPERAKEHPVEAAPRGEAVIGRLLPEERPGPVEEPIGPDRDGEAAERGRRPLDGVADAGRVRDDAGAEAGQLPGGALENVDFMTQVAQQERGRQAAHRSANDGDAHRWRIKDEG